MTKQELDLLLNHERLFSFFFEGIASTYTNIDPHYSEFLPIIDYDEPFQQVPDKLYKYMDLEGGLKSIEHSNIQFSDPLSFWKHEQLSDKTEFWFDRLYIDNVSLEQIYAIIVNSNDKYRHFDKKNIFIYLLHSHILNLTKRNKILCLAKTFNNQELWKDYSKGICIEYNTELFKYNHLKFAKNKKYKLIGNPVLYVEELIKFPIRATEDSWLSNLIFVKNQDPFIREDEYRILCTDVNYNPTKDVPIRKKRINEVKELLLNGNVRETLPIRPTFNRSYINKVYYNNTVTNETVLLEELRKYGIPWEKME